MQVNIIFTEERKGRGKEIAPCFVAENMDPPHSKGATSFSQLIKSFSAVGVACPSPNFKAGVMWAPRHPTLVVPRSVGPPEPFSLKIHPSPRS